MKDERPRINASDIAKDKVKDLKRKLGVKKESEVLAFLIAFYEMNGAKITVGQHEELLQRAAEIENQKTIKFKPL